jgi:hypothetical protein
MSLATQKRNDALEEGLAEGKLLTALPWRLKTQGNCGVQQPDDQAPSFKLRSGLKPESAGNRQLRILVQQLK